MDNNKPNQPDNHGSTAPRARVRVRDLLAMIEQDRRNREPVRLPVAAARAAIETLLGDESISRMAASYAAISPQLDETWFRGVLRQVAADFPAATPEQIKQGSRSAFDYCQRRFPIPYGERGYVAFPREFAARVIRAEVERATGR